MSSNHRSLPPFEIAGGAASAADRRAQVQRQLEERTRDRQLRIAQQASPQHTPEERIRLWEELHGLDLPRSTTHKLVRVIASHTALSVQEVHEEQQRRVSAAR